jgi:hypothetical protein
MTYGSFTELLAAVTESLRTVEMAAKTSCVLNADAIFDIMKREGYGNGIQAVLESAFLLPRTG